MTTRQGPTLLALLVENPLRLAVIPDDKDGQKQALKLAADASKATGATYSATQAGGYLHVERDHA